jgi:hypothetical protein
VLIYDDDDDNIDDVFCWVKVHNIMASDLQIISHDRKVELEASK